MSELQLQAGKWYRQRNGGKAYVAAIGSPFLATRAHNQAVGWIESTGEVAHWDTHGRYLAGQESLYDLVAEWVDPPVPVEHWCIVHVATNRVASVWSTLQGAVDYRSRSVQPERYRTAKMREVSDAE